MKLDRDNARIVNQAIKAGAITRSQRAELVRVALTIDPLLTPKTIGLAVAILRSGGPEEAERRAVEPSEREAIGRIGRGVKAWCDDVTTRAVPQCSRAGKRVDNACAPKAARFDLAGVAGWLGARTEIVVEGATGLVRLPARWALLPIGSLLTSNDPLRGFAPRPGYPRQLQERDYERGETEQNKVRSAAGALLPELLLSDNRDALTGAPIIDRARRVLGGNGRAMALILHMQAEGDGNRYARALRRELDCSLCFGLWGAPLAADSVLVRVLEHVDDVLAISRQLNAPLSAAMTRETEAFSLGQRMSDRTLGLLGEELTRYDSANEAIDGAGRSLVAALVADGIITTNQRPAWLQTLGGVVEEKLNRSGKERVIDAIVALSARDVRVTRDASPAVLQLMTQLAPVVIRFDRWDAANRSGYNWAAAYRRALPFVVATATALRDVPGLRAYWGTKQLFDAPELGIEPSRLKNDGPGLCAYWWLASLVGRPKIASLSARSTWVRVPPELRGEKGLYELRDRLELADQGEDPWSVLVAAGWPSLAGYAGAGANGMIDAITRAMAEEANAEGAIASFNETAAKKYARERAALLAEWQPQVVPIRAQSKVAEDERAALVASLRPLDEQDFRLLPFEGTPRKVKAMREAKPWAELRAGGLSLAIAKRLAEQGYSVASLRAALESGATIEGFGKARRAKLRELLGMPEEAKAPRKKRERLLGGRADGMPDEQFPPLALAEGTRHETEHTSDLEVAREIAKDHLAEDPQYYEKLEQMEGARKRLESLSQAELASELGLDPIEAIEREHARSEAEAAERIRQEREQFALATKRAGEDRRRSFEEGIRAKLIALGESDPQIVTIPTKPIGGVLQMEMLHYRNHKRGKNWLARLDPADNSYGFSRAFMDERGKWDWRVLNAKPLDVVENGADYISSGGRRNQDRQRWLLLEVGKDGSQAFEINKASTVEVLDLVNDYKEQQRVCDWPGSCEAAQ